MDTANTKREGRLEANGRCLTVLERKTVHSWMLQRYIKVLPFTVSSASSFGLQVYVGGFLS